MRRDGKLYRQEFERGVPLGDVEIAGKADKGESGTTISFLPDAEIFEEVDFSISTLVQRLRETAFLTRGLESSSSTSARARTGTSSTPKAASGTSSPT